MWANFLHILGFTDIGRDLKVGISSNLRLFISRFKKAMEKEVQNWKNIAPFGAWSKSDILDEELSIKLSREFPADLISPHYQAKDIPNYYLKTGRSIEEFDSLNLTPAWIEVLPDLMTIFESCVVEQRALVCDEHEDIFLKDRKFSETLSNQIDQEEISFSWTFAAMGALSYLMPHRDANTKIATLIIYFPSCEHDSVAALSGTHFHSLKGFDLAGTAPNKYLKWSAVNDIASVEYSRNTAVFFIRNAFSWHSVPPVHCDDRTYRTALIMNLRRTRAQDHTLRAKIEDSVMHLVDRVYRRFP